MDLFLKTSIAYVIHWNLTQKDIYRLPTPKRKMVQFVVQFMMAQLLLGFIVLLCSLTGTVAQNYLQCFTNLS